MKYCTEAVPEAVCPPGLEREKKGEVLIVKVATRRSNIPAACHLPAHRCIRTIRIVGSGQA